VARHDPKTPLELHVKPPLNACRTNPSVKVSGEDSSGETITLHSVTSVGCTLVEDVVMVLLLKDENCRLRRGGTGAVVIGDQW